MGLSSSQARLLSLTGRMHDIEYKAQKLEAQKLQMANESRHVYQEYEDALNTTKFQYKTIGADGKVSFIDATYGSLSMYGSGAMQQYVLCDTNSNKVYIPTGIKNAYTAAGGSASEFAKKAAGLSYIPTPPSPAHTPVIPTPPTKETLSTDPAISKSGLDRNITLNMGETKTFEVDNGTTGGAVKLTLANGFNSGYQYTFKAKTGTQMVKASYLNNGRLQIEAYATEINAKNVDTQKDDIILIGNLNTLNTYGGDDIVRVGGAIGFGSSVLSNQNTINTGAGDDYVTMTGYYSTVDMGNGSNDYITYLYENMKTTDASMSNGAADIFQNSITTSTNGVVDNVEQGSLGDCRFLALMASLGNLSSYVNISSTTTPSTGWNVSFPNAASVGKSTTSIFVSKDEIEANHIASGDLDVVLTEYALNQLMQSVDGKNLEHNSYQNYSRWLFGTGQTSMYIVDGRYDSSSTTINYGDGNTVNYASNVRIQNGDSNGLLQSLLTDKSNSKISNIVVGINTTDESLHLKGGHAYALNKVTSDYVELINPWYNQDVLRISWADFMRCAGSVYVFGDQGTGTHTANYIGGSGSGNLYQATLSESPEITETSEITSQVVEIPAYYNENDENNVPVMPLPTYGASEEDWNKYNYYLQLYDLISKSDFIEIDDSCMTDKQYLVNMINGGFGYLKMFDKSEGEWVGTNIATNTNLQEVSDEKLLKKAEAKYEANMRQINAKDKKYDTELAALEAERNAIKTEMDTLKSVAKENVDRTYKLFS